MSDKMTNVVHVGLCKTGTTFLQQNIFSKHSGIHYLGKVVLDDEALLEAGVQLARQSSVQFVLDDVKAIFNAEFQKTAPGQVRVLSEEDLTTFKFLDPAICAARLRQVFGDARILLTVRNPFHWLESLYFFRLWVGQPDVMQPFADWLRWALAQPYVLNPITEIYFAQIARLYEDTFGRENVLVVPYELLKENPVDYFTTMGSFMSVDVEELLTLNRARDGKTKEKSRMSVCEAEFHQLLKSLGEKNTRVFAKGLAKWIDRLPKEQRAPLLTRLKAARKESVDSPEWRQVFQQTRKALRPIFADSPAATIDWPPSLQNRMISQLGPSIRALSEQRKLDLGRFGYPLAD